LNGEVQKEMVARTGPWINTTRYSVPVYSVGAGVPRVHVTVDSRWASVLQPDFDSVPIPADARTAGGTDMALTVYQPATDTLWDFWHLQRKSDGWHAGWGGRMTNVSTNPGYFSGSFGATATGIPQLGGLITVNELSRGRIDHALAIGIPNTAAGTFTWPAQRTDGRLTGADAIPEGTRFRIDAGVDLSSLHLTPAGLAIARAVQRYGMVVRDTAGCVIFTAEDPVAMGVNPYPRLFGGLYPSDVLHGFPWHALRVVAPQRAG
jgi:hypothetical protein